jgi:hypothetical protein
MDERIIEHVADRCWTHALYLKSESRIKSDLEKHLSRYGNVREAILSKLVERVVDAFREDCEKGSRATERRFSLALGLLNFERKSRADG